MKKPFVTLEQLQEIVKQYPTPFHLYDEAGIRRTARAVNDAFAWNPGFREYFAVKATPTPGILKIPVSYTHLLGLLLVWRASQRTAAFFRSSGSMVTPLLTAISMAMSINWGFVSSE